MTPLLYSELIVRVGLPLAQQLLAMFQSGNAPISAAQFETLVKLGQYRPEDALTAAGIKIADGKVLPV